MELKKVQYGGVDIAVVKSDEILLKDVQSALDFIALVKSETRCVRIVLNKEAIAEDFFRLSTCLAGDILQKFINYHVKFAVVGDLFQYKSKPLNDFMYESNHGRDVFFAATEEEALKSLAQAK